MSLPRALVALAVPFLIAGGLALQAAYGGTVRDGFDGLDGSHWVAGPGAEAHDGTLTLTPGRGARGIAGVRSRAVYGGGRFAARLRAASAPGALTSFFLYRGPDELDVELPSDGARTALLTVSRGGRITHQARVELGFDPAAELHTYTVERRPTSVTFGADGRRLRTFRGGIPRRRLHVYANASGDTPATFDWIEIPGR